MPKAPTDAIRAGFQSFARAPTVHRKSREVVDSDPTFGADGPLEVHAQVHAGVQVAHLIFITVE